MTSNTLDKATSLLPALLNERLPELGIDFALIYPSFGLSINGMAESDLHLAAVQAYNMMLTCSRPCGKVCACSHRPFPYAGGSYRGA